LFDSRSSRVRRAAKCGHALDQSPRRKLQIGQIDGRLRCRRVERERCMQRRFAFCKTRLLGQIHADRAQYVGIAGRGDIDSEHGCLGCGGVVALPLRMAQLPGDFCIRRMACQHLTTNTFHRGPIADLAESQHELQRQRGVDRRIEHMGPQQRRATLGSRACIRRRRRAIANHQGARASCGSCCSYARNMCAAAECAPQRSINQTIHSSVAADGWALTANSLLRCAASARPSASANSASRA